MRTEHAVYAAPRPSPWWLKDVLFALAWIGAACVWSVWLSTDPGKGCNGKADTEVDVKEYGKPVTR